MNFRRRDKRRCVAHVQSVIAAERTETGVHGRRVAGPEDVAIPGAAPIPGMAIFAFESFSCSSLENNPIFLENACERYSAWLDIPYCLSFLIDNSFCMLVSFFFCMTLP